MGGLPVKITAANNEDPTRLASRGVEAYQAGRLELARLFFERSFRQSALTGNTEWSLRAACNLADLALETRTLNEAERWLELASQIPGKDLNLVFWKRSQLAFARGQSLKAQSLLDSGLQLGKLEGLTKLRMEMDRLRYQFTTLDSNAWNTQFTALKSRCNTSQQKETVELWAWASMRRGHYLEAERAWTAAMAQYRDLHRFVALGNALAYRAICLYALKRNSESIRLTEQADAVFEEIGFKMGQLRVAALKILLEDDVMLAKSGREIDFLTGDRTLEDWSTLLNDYSQSYPPLLGRLELLHGR